LGTHFSKSFGIQYLGADGKKHYAHTTSWGTSSRLVGAVIMTHGDDDGLVLPPAIAPHQVVIIPILPEQNEYAHKVAKQLKGIRVLVDDSDSRSADKMWKWIKKGAPVRIEVGANEVNDETITLTRRDIGKSSKETIPAKGADAHIRKLLTAIQSDLLKKSQELNARMTHHVKDVAELKKELAKGTIGFFRLPYSMTLAPEFEALMEEFKISRRCLDDADPTYVFVAKSY
jgi:prolyl-tRNA synthetase